MTAPTFNTNLSRRTRALQQAQMSKSEQAINREQRLAAKLRENLKRRKGQAKARSDSEGQAPDPQPAPEPVTVKKP